MVAGGGLRGHNRIIIKIGGDIQKLFSGRAKCKLNDPFGGQNGSFKKRVVKLSVAKDIILPGVFSGKIS